MKYINTRRLLKLLSPECSILESMMVKSPFLSSPCLYSHVDRNTSFLDPLCCAWQSLVLVRGRKIVPPISSSTSWRAMKTVYRGATSVNWVSGWIYRKGEVIRERNGIDVNEHDDMKMWCLNYKEECLPAELWHLCLRLKMRIQRMWNRVLEKGGE